MADFFHSRVQSFRYAFAGWWYVIRTQKNAWIHAVASIAVFAVSAWLALPLLSWAILVLSIAMVWMAETINTALETIVDLASPDLHPLAKVGKDVGAAAVLITALAAVVIGLLLIGPPLVNRLRFLFIH